MFKMMKMQHTKNILNILRFLDYYDLITQDNEIIDELFEGNIRDFEGQTVEVNKNIKDTLENVYDADYKVEDDNK